MKSPPGCLRFSNGHSISRCKCEEMFPLDLGNKVMGGHGRTERRGPVTSFGAETLALWQIGLRCGMSAFRGALNVL